MREETTHELYSDLLSIYFFELPRLRKASMKGLSPMEGWLFLLKNLHTFADTPEGMDKHFEPVVRAARMKAMPSKEQLQYFRAMISEETKQDYYLGGYDAGMEAGEEIGREKGLAEGMEKGMEKGMENAVSLLFASGLSVAEISERLKMEEEDVSKMIKAKSAR